MICNKVIKNIVENHRLVPNVNEKGFISGSYLLINSYVKKTNFKYDIINL